MSSDRKITANRNNAKKSTGPRSKAGREASRRNARRHGLAIDIGADPAFHEDIEQLATVLSLSSGAQKVSEHARQAAEAELDLTRIRKIRARLFETLYFADTAAPNGMTELNNALAKLERYERRAFSRRKRALRAV
jgi:glutathione synthase/RimK-type ligase-like ATP-grasp enzyme